MGEKFQHVQFTSDDIGVQLFESITKGLYTDARHCIREYVQNEYDANASIVYVDVAGRTVSITGDGQGMDHDALTKARRVGYSEKNPEVEAGFRGIGIWSGVAVSQRLNVITKSKNAPEGYYLRVDAHGLREAIRHRVQQSLISALTENVQMRTISSDEMDRKYGTRVELVDVLGEHDRILNQTELMAYLSQTAPVAMNPFQPFAPGLLDRLTAEVKGYREMSVRVNQKPVYRPPDRDTQLQPPVFDTIATGEGQTLAFAWYAMHKEPGTLPPDERGMVYKSKGFTVGDPERTTVRKLEAGASVQQNFGWVCGEIHLLSPLLVPTSERVDIETNSTAEYLRNRVRELMRRIDKEVRLFSEKRSAESHLVAAEAALSSMEAGESVDDKLERLPEVHRAGELLKQDLKSPKTAAEVKPRVERILREIESTKKELFKDIRSPITSPAEASARSRKAMAKKTLEAEQVDQALPALIRAFKMSPPEETLLRVTVQSLRGAGVPESKITRFLGVLENKLSYSRVH